MISVVYGFEYDEKIYKKLRNHSFSIVTGNPILSAVIIQCRDIHTILDRIHYSNSERRKKKEYIDGVYHSLKEYMRENNLSFVLCKPKWQIALCKQEPVRFSLIHPDSIHNPEKETQFM